MKLTAPKAGENVSLLVAVRVRPVLKSEQLKNKDAQTKDILRVIDKRMVLVMDPEEPEEKDYLDQVQNRSKEKKYTFDVAFGAESTNSKLYKATIAPLIKHVISGHNCTVFAYGATGSGKTYTMVGSHADSGLMVRSMESLFAQSAQLHKDEDVTITASYLEVYNEVLYDLLVPNSAELPLREDPVLGAVPSGLTFAKVSSASDILHLLEAGNARRKTERTDANTQSSRSHAVLEVHLKRQGRNHYKSRHLVGKLALVDLAGSERAAETNNFGQKLRDGANINRSLLSLANCINQLGKAGASGGRAYIPYRNSKLTRLLKDGLSGNSRTVMIATVAASADQYHHSINTLKYANRAKDIKTHIVQNVGSVESHISDYRRIIDNLQGEVRHLKEQLALQDQSRSPSVAGTDPNMANPEGVSLVDTLVSSIHNNVAERINLQKALFEVQDADVRTRMQLEALESSLKGKNGDLEGADAAEKAEAEELSQRIKDNESEISVLRGAIDANEKAQQSVHARIDGTIEGQGNRNPQLLKILKQFRLQALQLVELEFQMAVRDQIIDEQRTMVGNLWKVLGELAPSERISDIASELGIVVDDATEGAPAVQVPSFASGCMAAVAAAAAAVTSGASGSRPSLSTLQPSSSSRPSVGIASSSARQTRNRSSSPTPTSHISIQKAAVLASNAVNTTNTIKIASDSTKTSKSCLEATADVRNISQEGSQLQESWSLPTPHSKITNGAKLESDCDTPSLLTSLSVGTAASGASKFPGTALSTCIPEHSVPFITDASGSSAVKGKSPTAWGEPAPCASLAKEKGTSNQVPTQASNTAPTKADENGKTSSDSNLSHSIGVQGMRVLSSLKVAGWSLAGGGGARSAHIMREESQSKQKAGDPGEQKEGLGIATRTPIRGWGALDDISSASPSPVRGPDSETSQASRNILTGICGHAAGSNMRVARSSVDDESDAPTPAPPNGQEAWTDDSPTDTKRCTSFSFRSRQANSLRAKLSSPQGKNAGTSKARSSGASRTSLGMRLLGSLRSTRPSRRNSMGGTSTSTDGPPRTASGGGELEVGAGGGPRGGLVDATSANANTNGNAAAAAAIHPSNDDAPVSRGSGGASRESDRVMPFTKQDVDAAPEADAPVATRGIQQTDPKPSKQFLSDTPLQDRLSSSSVSGLRLQGTSAERPEAIHAWTGPTDTSSSRGTVDASNFLVASSTTASKSKPVSEIPSAAVSSSAAAAASAVKAACTEPWESGFKERRRVVGGSVAAVLGTSAFPTTAGGSSTSPGAGAAVAVVPPPAANAAGTFPQFGSGLPGDLNASKDVGGLAGGSLASMAPSDRLKRLKSHRDRSGRISMTKQGGDAKLKEFAMEVVGGGVQGASSKIKP